jgi:DNA invertase Pin-like site-specific DNA recombinase
MRAALYARRSTEDARAVSVTRQVAHAREFAEKSGYTVDEDHIFVDDGVSGAEFRDRPGLLRLLNLASASPRPFDAVVMAEASRLGRDRLRTELVARDLHETGIKLFYYLTGEEERLDTPEGRFILAARSFAAELERAKAKDRTRDAHIARARKGQVTGGCVYGFSNVAVASSGGPVSSTDQLRSHVVRKIDQKEAEVLRGIFRMFADGFGLRRIARTLNGDAGLKDESRRYFGGERIPPPRKGTGSWAPGAIDAMLRRELYRGVLVWGRHRNVDRDGRTRLREKQPEASLIRRDVPELQIISDDLWKRADARRKMTGPRGGGVPKKQPASILSGLASCAICSGPIVIAGSRKHTRCYGCGWRIHRGTTVCENTVLGSVPALDEAFITAVEETVFSDAARKYLVDTSKRLLEEALVDKDVIARAEETVRRLETKVAAIQRAIEEAAESGVVPAILVTRLRDLEQEQRAAKLAALETRRLHRATGLDVRRAERDLMRRLADLRSEMLSDKTGARRVLELLLEGKVVFIPELDSRTYRVRATLAPARVTSSSSPTGFEPVYHPLDAAFEGIRAHRSVHSLTPVGFPWSPSQNRRRPALPTATTKPVTRARASHFLTPLGFMLSARQISRDVDPG